MNILAIESSCDETAAAVVRDGRFILSNAVATQIDIHALYGGVVPEIASRAHTEAITNTVKCALRDAELTMTDMDAVAVTNRPGLIGALLIGVSFAKGLAYTYGKPLIAVHHIRGHIAANYTYYNGVKEQLLTPPFTALVMSGGHTSLIAVDSYTSYRLLGCTRDDAAGEAFDKVARLIGLPYPGGAKMDALAERGNKNAVTFSKSTVKDHPLDFSFSGLKTSAINYLHQKEQLHEAICREDVASSFTKAVCDEITLRIERYFSTDEGRNSEKLVLAGGVSANSHIREALLALCKKRNKTLYLPPKGLCGDNAVMIASQAYFEYNSPDFTPSSLTLNAYPTADVADNER